MANHLYPVEVQSDFLEKITRAKPIHALAEFIWNSLDADATTVEVFFEDNDLGALSCIIVRDNGSGMECEKAPELFGNLGGSWKKYHPATPEGRFLHGQDGRGRFKVFSLGRVALWEVTYRKDARLVSFSILMTASNMKQVTVSDPEEAPEGSTPGVKLTVSEVNKNFRSLLSEGGLQELAEIFAIYLASYKQVSIFIAGSRLDPDHAIASQGSFSLTDIVAEGATYEVRLEIIEWRAVTNRAMYLCNEKGFPLWELDRRYHVGSFQFSAYVKSSYISVLQREGTIELSEMNPLIAKVTDEAYSKVKEYFRERAAQEAQTVVDEWKEENIYPYQGEAKSRLEQVERQVFDIVAVNVAHHLPEFSTTPTKSRAFNLRLLRQAIEKSPEELQLILSEVLRLPKRKQEELAELLRDVSLSAVISAAKVVADRLKFLSGLESILFDAESRQRLKERSQLHRIIAQNCWLFGEEYNLSVDDQSLTEVLRRHREKLGVDTAIDEPVKHVSKDRGIIDLMLSRTIKRHRADDLMHLIVELKAPKVKIDKKEILQIEEYAMSVMKDDRFKGVNVTWEFWVISDDYGEYAEYRMGDRIPKDGKIHESGNFSIWVKTWGQVLEENGARMRFFQQHLEYEADKGASLKHLQEHYANFLRGVSIEEPPESEQLDQPTQ